MISFNKPNDMSLTIIDVQSFIHVLVFMFDISIGLLDNIDSGSLILKLQWKGHLGQVPYILALKQKGTQDL